MINLFSLEYSFALCPWKPFALCTSDTVAVGALLTTAEHRCQGGEGKNTEIWPVWRFVNQYPLFQEEKKEQLHIMIRDQHGHPYNE